MSQRLKLWLLQLMRAVGGFALARYWTRHQLRILCYHGISIGDQHRFEPFLFMRPEVFERRMRLLRANAWRILGLDDAVAELRAGKTFGCPVVVTIDDGWKSTADLAVPTLKRLDIPATVYVTTYYCERPADVFNVAMFYMLWKTPRDTVHLQTGHPELDGEYRLTKGDHGVGLKWMHFANDKLDWQGRQQLLVKIAEALELNADHELREGRFCNMDAAGVARLASLGIDVQLHTHRHRLPDDWASVEREVVDNRKRLEQWTRKECRHFCYPSGEYSAEQPARLARLEVISATTCDPGFNDATTDPLLLRRILDRDNMSDLEFEALLSGISLSGIAPWLRRYAHG